MFVSFSKVMRKIGGSKVTVGTRVTKKNFWFFLLISFFVNLGKFFFYSIALIFWIIYAIGYGIYALVILIIALVRKIKSKQREAELKKINERLGDNYVAPWRQVDDLSEEDVAGESEKETMDDAASSTSE